MRKWLPLLLVALHFAPLLAQAPDQALAARLASGTLRWGGDPEGGAPFQLYSPEDPNRLVGFEVELLDLLVQRLSQRAGRTIRAEFVPYEWVSLQPGLLVTREFDCVASGMESTPDNRRALRLSRDYYRFHQVLSVRRDEARFSKLEECRTLRVATLGNSAADRLLQRMGVRQIIRFDSQVEPYFELERGRLDAVLLDNPIAFFYGRAPALRALPERYEPAGYAMAFRPDDNVLAAAVDRALGELFADGSWYRVLARWHLWNEEQAQLAAGPQRAAELEGLGFDPQGRPRGDLPPVEPVAPDFLTASSRQWTIDKYLPLLAAAAWTTVRLATLSMLFAVVWGLVVAVARLYGPAPLRAAALAYVEIVRGVPLLFVIFLLYFGLPAYGLSLPAQLAAVLGLGLNYAAYEAEIYRSAILAVAPGQWDAARALGMRDTSAFRRIILPQALRTALGPMTSDFVALFKDTSLVSVIGIIELNKEFLTLARSSLKFGELGLITAVLYLAMSLPLGYLSRWLEGRASHGR